MLVNKVIKWNAFQPQKCPVQRLIEPKHLKLDFIRTFSANDPLEITEFGEIIINWIFIVSLMLPIYEKYK